LSEIVPFLPARLRRQGKWGALVVEVLETFSALDWCGPFAPDVQKRALSALERGRILYFPNLDFSLQEEERRLLSASGGDGRAKNISLDPVTKRSQGTSLNGPERTRLEAMMVCALLPDYAGRLERARTSFRPVEITGRQYSPLKDDRRLHVDAFPSRPTRGRRILRLFTNIGLSNKSRVWRVGQPFEDFARNFLPQIGAPIAGSAWLMQRFGMTKGRRSDYDHIMLGLHDAAKRDDNFQAKAPQTETVFPPGTTWLVFTDQVLHAAVAGQFALEQTFHLDVQAMAEPALSPLRVLERLSGRALV
jgi:3-deoxy-D-manno-oct-2-ulosonic acid (Kdo) hydroxylase